MPFVIDASVTACWALVDEEDPLATAALRRLDGDSGLVPARWWFEIRNTLLMAERRGRISVADSGTFLSQLPRLPINIDRQPQDLELLRLARRYRLTAHDAAYIELAQHASVPPATLDAGLARAARAEQVPLVGPGGRAPAAEPRPLSPWADRSHPAILSDTNTGGKTRHGAQNSRRRQSAERKRHRARVGATRVRHRRRPPRLAGIHRRPGRRAVHRRFRRQHDG